MSEKEISTKIKNVQQIMECEGFTLTEKDKSEMAEVLFGRKTVKDIVNDVVHELGILKI